MDKIRRDAINRYAKQVADQGYAPSEVTLLIIGYAAGWDQFSDGLDRLVQAVHSQPKVEK